jgi:hypothetical protein
MRITKDRDKSRMIKIATPQRKAWPGIGSCRAKA